MKKFISVILAAAMAAGQVGSLAVSAADKKADTDNDIVLFGDSIAAGFTVDNSVKSNYGEICADYLGGNVSNYAVTGDTSEGMLNVIKNLDDSQKKQLKNAEYVFISVGANDLMHYAVRYLLDYAARKNLLVDGKTAKDIPENPRVSDLLGFMDLEKVAAYAGNSLNAMDLVAELKKVCNGLKTKNEDKNYPGIIPEVVIPNITAAVAEIKAVNPNARIIVQTIYNPAQISPEYIEQKENPNYSTFIGQLRSNFRGVLDTFVKQLSEVEGIETVDINKVFTSLPEGTDQTNANPGHTDYFVNIKSEGGERDIHPNQAGHIVIASAYLNTIGKTHDDTGLLSQSFKALTDTSAFPSIALDCYKSAAGNIIGGDVNFDEKVDARDASLVLKNYAVISGSDPTILSEIQNKCANVNGDTSCDANDASAILRYYAYLSNNETGTIEEFLKLK